MYAYCLFCETGKCRFIVREVMGLLACTAISPKQVQHTWSKGRMVDRIRDFLPGYVFVYSEEKLEISQVRYIPSVLRCLKSSDLCYELAGADEAFARMLLDQGGMIGKTPVYEEDQQIRLTEGAFAGVNARILKVDHRAQRMQIEIPFARRLVKTWIEYEIVSGNQKTEAVTETREEIPDGQRPDQQRTAETAAGIAAAGSVSSGENELRWSNRD